MKRSSKHFHQVAALPLRVVSKNRLEILMITSRETKRWVVPKGWPMEGRTDWQAAAEEALEEAGVTGSVLKKSVGSYRYTKIRKDQPDLPCDVSLFPMLVKEEMLRWKEMHERKRKWFSLSSAAKRVWEKELRSLLRNLDKKRATERLIAELT